MTVPHVTLGTVIRGVQSQDPVRSGKPEFVYIDIAAVDQETKTITGAKRIPSADAPSRARQIVSAGDVLVSTVRPNLNAVARLERALDSATASTGFAVLRPTEVLDSRYLFHWVRSPGFVADMVRKATGASYPAVSERIIAESSIPLPPIEEQRRIADILERADALRTKRRGALALLDDLSQSIFLDMFGEPRDNPKRFPVKRLAELGSLDRGVSKHRPRNDPRLLGGPYPLIQTGDVANSHGVIEASTASYSELGLKQSKLWPTGTLCITIAANIAKTGILTFPACFPDSVVGFTADEQTTVYVRSWLGFMQRRLEAAAPMSAQRNINLALLRSLPIPSPPSALIYEFASRMEHLKSLRYAARRGQVSLSALFASLQGGAFAGLL